MDKPSQADLVDALSQALPLDISGSVIGDRFLVCNGEVLTLTDNDNCGMYPYKTEPWGVWYSRGGISAGGISSRDSLRIVARLSRLPEPPAPAAPTDTEIRAALDVLTRATTHTTS